MPDRHERDLQTEYYTRTARLYDDLHVSEGDEHGEALELIALFAHRMGARRILDVGAGTGRAIAFLGARGFDVIGIEPVEALRAQAIAKGIPADRIVEGYGAAIPFPESSFDFVIETGVLHHVKEPSAVVAEMLRVARNGVFLSDENRFAYGGSLRRGCTYTLSKLGLFPLAYRLHTRGKGYRWSEGDGLAYSYSVYDNIGQLALWGDRTYAIPLGKPSGSSWFQPLFTNFHILLGVTRHHPILPDKGANKVASEAD
jgi:SAM-dependent methyltransferase